MVVFGSESKHIRASAANVLFVVLTVANVALARDEIRWALAY